MRIRAMIRRLFDTGEAVFHDREGQAVPRAQVLAEYQGIKNCLLNEADEHGVVAINLEYDYRYLLAVYACMEVGIPYVPLRPSWPSSRVEQIRRLSPFSVLLDANNIEAACRSVIRSGRDSFAASPEKPLYIIYTSGTTGEPKGVVILRRAYEHFLAWVDDLLPCGPDNRILFVADFTFDMSLLDIGLFLLKRCQCFFSQFGANVFRLADEIETYAINSIATVPNNFSMLLQDAIFERCNFESLRYLLLGGSRFAYGLYTTLFRKLPGARVYNFYGPTEATVYCHYKVLSGDEPADVLNSTVSIGKPAPGLSCVLLDADGKEVTGPGAPGELLIGGVQVMKEYLRDPQRTRQNLLTERGVTYYRTGDIAFTDAKGDYYITGRKDDTIKRRGYRVNLLDIDSYIQKTACVSDCVTVAIPDAAADNVLVSFVIPKEPVSESALRQTISRVLVDYQVPDYIEFRTSFPTNNSGKVCRETLAKQFAASTHRRAG